MYHMTNVADYQQSMVSVIDDYCYIAKAQLLIEFAVSGL